MRIVYRLSWSPKDELDTIVDTVSRNTENFTFLQIGANDGMINDPIYKFIFRDKWQGVRIEPLPTPFKKLKYLHSGSTVVPMQCLVAEQAGRMPLYHLSFSHSRWATGIASLDRDSLQRQIDNGYVEGRAKKYGESLPRDKNTWITSTELKVEGLNDLIQNHFPKGLDLLQIDVEGFDHKLIGALDLDRFQPKLIRFEKLHIPPEQLQSCLAKLKDHGYRLSESDMDFLAVKH